MNFVLTLPLLLPPFKADIIPNVDKVRNIVWSEIMAILNNFSL